MQKEMLLNSIEKRELRIKEDFQISKGTLDKKLPGITCKDTGKLVLDVHCDSDYGGTTECRKSTSAYIIFFP